MRRTQNNTFEWNMDSQMPTSGRLGWDTSWPGTLRDPLRMALSKFHLKLKSSFFKASAWLPWVQLDLLCVWFFFEERKQVKIADTQILAQPSPVREQSEAFYSFRACNFLWASINPQPRQKLHVSLCWGDEWSTNYSTKTHFIVFYDAT